MTHVRFALAALAVLAIPLAAFADRDEGGHGRRGEREGRQVYWEGNCRIERKWHDGELREKRKCRGPAPAAAYVAPPQPVYVQPSTVYVQPQPVYVAPPPVVVQPAPLVVDPGVVIQGTIHLK